MNQITDMTMADVFRPLANPASIPWVTVPADQRALSASEQRDTRHVFQSFNLTFSPDFLAIPFPDTGADGQNNPAPVDGVICRWDTDDGFPSEVMGVVEVKTRADLSGFPSLLIGADKIRWGRMLAERMGVSFFVFGWDRTNGNVLRWRVTNERGGFLFDLKTGRVNVRAPEGLLDSPVVYLPMTKAKVIMNVEPLDNSRDRTYLRTTAQKANP